jgi:hypothetical protein
VPFREAYICGCPSEESIACCKCQASFIPHTLAGLRDLRCSVPQELARTTTRNALQFFDFEGTRYPKPEFGPGLPYTFG